ncbi:efflux RND transporter permease subunit [Aliagarivorans marinus]|uniref:efflux RND transporter permease subunit n=1 Tax=Aliagarivorans marinus TaxID=561965 RepID=UPI0004252449|nr:efflux RND transporter permease subunit [Aliagarivorans marinus]
MRFTDVFIRRPVMAFAFSALLLIIGVQALLKLQIREYPELTNTVITVDTAYFGAPANVIQGFITQPLQQAIAEADHLDYILSSSAMGRSSVSAHMKIGADPDAALSEIMAKVNSVRARLPAEALDPNISRSTGSSTSILYISLRSDRLTRPEVADFARRVIQPQMVTVTGVAKANVYGPEMAMRIWLDPVKLANYGLTAAEVVDALRQNNYRAAPGQAESRFMVYDVEVDTDLKTQAQFEQLIISRSDAGLVRLRDVAEMELAAARETVIAKASGDDSITIAIDPTPTANPINVAKGVKQLLPGIADNLPEGMTLEPLYDATEYIEASIKEVLMTIAEAAVIVVVVIFLFMGNLRAVIIPVIAIPLSLIGVCLAMQLLGFSLNLLTLLAMVLAIGLVVDDAIVVVENVDRHIRQGMTPFEAAIVGTREIAMPVIAMTITLAAVYAPIAMVEGMTGVLFSEFALTLAGAVFVSGFVALTLSPMMCSKLLKKSEQPKGFEEAVHRFLDKLDAGYDYLLGGALKLRGVILSFGFIVLAMLLPLNMLIPSELAPTEEKGAVMLIANGPAGANLDYMDQHTTEIGRRSLEVQDIARAFTLAGIPSSTQGLGFLSSVPWEEQSTNQAEQIENLTAAISDIAGVSASIFPLPALPGSDGFPMQFVLQSQADYRSMVQLADQLMQRAWQSGLFVFVDSDTKFESPRLNIRVNRDKAGAYGVRMADIATTLSTLMGDGYVNHINYDGRAYEVIPQVQRSYRLSPESIGQYYVKAVDGKLVPLENLVDWHLDAQPAALLQMNQINAITINAVIMPGRSLGDAIAYMEQQAAELLPVGYSFDFKGEARQFKQEGAALYTTFVLALAIIFLVLAAQFESLRDPLVIMFTVPLAICGALLMMAWGFSSMNIYTQIGLITLVGLIAKHGILMCEVAKERQMNQGEDRLTAIRHAARVRLRAVLMTTISMVAGLVPLLMASGPGAAARFDIGLVICAGLSIGTLFTLFVLPVVYSYLGSKHKPLPEVDYLDALTPKA